MLWFVARNTLIVHSERLLPSVMRQWQFLIPHESMMWFVIVHLLVGTPWVSWLLGDGLCLVFHLLSCLVHQICIILVFQRGGSWAVFFPAARCLTYSTHLITRNPRRFFTPSPDERCRSEKGTGSASAPPIDQCGQEEIASFIVLFVTTNRNPLSHRCCNKQSFLTDHTPHRRLFGIVHVEMNHT